MHRVKGDTFQKDADHFFEAYKKDYGRSSELNFEKLHAEYCAFSCYIQDLCIYDGDYIIDTGNYQNVNAALIRNLEWKRKHHPIIWRIIQWLIRV